MFPWNTINADIPSEERDKPIKNNGIILLIANIPDGVRSIVLLISGNPAVKPINKTKRREKQEIKSFLYKAKSFSYLSGNSIGSFFTLRKLLSILRITR